MPSFSFGHGSKLMGGGGGGDVSGEDEGYAG